MFDKADRIKFLLRKYLSENLSAEEKKEFDTWLWASVENHILVASFSNDILFENLLKDYFNSATIAERLLPPI